MPTEAKPEAVVTPRKLFDIGAAVQYLRAIGATAVTVNFIRGLIASGQIAHVRMGRRFYVTKDALDRWIVVHERKN